MIRVEFRNYGNLPVFHLLDNLPKDQLAVGRPADAVFLTKKGTRQMLAASWGEPEAALCL